VGIKCRTHQSHCAQLLRPLRSPYKAPFFPLPTHRTITFHRPGEKRNVTKNHVYVQWPLSNMRASCTLGPLLYSNYRYFALSSTQPRPPCRPHFFNHTRPFASITTLRKYYNVDIYIDKKQKLFIRTAVQKSNHQN